MKSIKDKLLELNMLHSGGKGARGNGKSTKKNNADSTKKATGNKAYKNTLSDRPVISLPANLVPDTDVYLAPKSKC